MNNLKNCLRQTIKEICIYYKNEIKEDENWMIEENMVTQEKNIFHNSMLS